MAATVVGRTAVRSFEESGFHGLSVFAAVERPIEQLCVEEPDLARYGKVRMSTFGRLRAGGFAVVPTLGLPHYDVVLPESISGR